MSGWLRKKSILIGEAHSLDHMGTLHALGIISEETKYLGGLRIAIDFKCSKRANEFLEDESRWKDWFKWLGRSDQHDVRYGRIPWLKILGVPLEFWDEDNFHLLQAGSVRL
ncbi:unnamed protein product [Lactuca virosa]|uniref:DUF4283 domain-containing protein n=1 Tax=Lactuca virosa TaxID=75947 RepID=A0AAU9M9S6_9ASTR|nr:unnamed protein product [Lactuca virosa]